MRKIIAVFFVLNLFLYASCGHKKPLILPERDAQVSNFN